MGHTYRGGKSGCKLVTLFGGYSYDGVCVGDVICNDDGGDGVGVGDVVDGFVPILRNLLVVNKCLLSNSHLALWKNRTLQRLGEVFKLLFS